jgi:hypothetical protein
MFEGNAQNYITFDNFEMLGICQEKLNSRTWTDVYVENPGSSGFLASNLYIHGWTHTPFSCVAGSPPVGRCFGIFGFHGGNTITLDSIVIDGSDSDPAGAGQFFVSPGIIKHSVFRYVATGSTGACHVVHDNLWEYNFNPADNEAHGDVLLCIGEHSGVNAYYNNLIRHIGGSASTNGVNFWIGPSAGTTDYFFNNIFYDMRSAGNYFNIQNTGGGTVYAFNSTLQNSANGPVMDCQGGSLTHAINMHFITDAGGPFYGNGTCATTTNFWQTNAVANGQGYTANETYAYSPTATGNSTVNAGTNEQTALCGALLTAAVADPTLSDAAVACQHDASYACTYNTSDHTVTCPARTPVARPSTGAWNVGAYQYATNQIQNAKVEMQNYSARPLLPSPIKAALLKQYLQIKQDLIAYDLAGNVVEKNRISRAGIYLVKQKTSSAFQKVAVVD